MINQGTDQGVQHLNSQNTDSDCWYTQVFYFTFLVNTLKSKTPT